MVAPASIVGYRSRGGSSLRALVAVVAAACLLAPAGCGGTEQPEPTARDRPGGWQALPRPPLSPRTGAFGLWTGDEVLVVGGSDAAPCPPSASCVPPDEPPLADGAAFDLETRTWRRIADAPVRFEGAEGVAIGRTAYLWIPGSPGRPQAPRAFLAYRPDEDRWRTLPLPPRAGELALARAGGRLVAYARSDEHGRTPDLLFDPAAERWSELPDDPLSPSFDRVIAWSGRELVLFAHDLVPNPGSARPSLTRAAALDLATGSWRRLPDSEILGAGPWVATGDGRLVNPTLGGADGGETNNWGRTYPYGAILDPAAGRWSALPASPEGAEVFAAGVLTETGAVYFGAAGSVFDARNGSWLEVPPLEGDALVSERTVVAARRGLLVFGGARWRSANAGDAELLADAQLWSPSAAS